MLTDSDGNDGIAIMAALFGEHDEDEAEDVNDADYVSCSATTKTFTSM
jgi:hypothetical protein